MPAIKDISGMRIGHLVVLKYEGQDLRHHALWSCLCDCGKTIRVNSSNLIWGNTKSCGCLRKKLNTEKCTTHGLSKTRLYEIWAGMKKRCINPNSHAYERYGGREITVCNEWMDFPPFYKWAIANGYEEDLTIERKNNDGNYEPSNCVWATYKIQARNMKTNHRISFRGEVFCINEWAEKLNIAPGTLWNRIKLGWSTERAFTQPVRRSS